MTSDFLRTLNIRLTTEDILCFLSVWWTTSLDGGFWTDNHVKIFFNSDVGLRLINDVIFDVRFMTIHHVFVIYSELTCEFWHKITLYLVRRADVRYKYGVNRVLTNVGIMTLGWRLKSFGPPLAWENPLNPTASSLCYVTWEDLNVASCHQFYEE